MRASGLLTRSAFNDAPTGFPPGVRIVTGLSAASRKSPLPVVECSFLCQGMCLSPRHRNGADVVETWFLSA